MNLRTPEQLLDAISNNSQKRRRELTTLASMIADARGAHKQTLSRSGVLLAYAHWEGFAKNAADMYLRHISSLALPLSALKAPFQALASKAMIIKAGTAKTKINPHLAVIKHLVDDINSSKFVHYTEAITTESNLTWDIFLNIITSINIPENKWETYKGFINDLVSERCAIAHGELYEVDESHSIESLTIVRELIAHFSTEIENAAVLKTYMKLPK